MAVHGMTGKLVDENRVGLTAPDRLGDGLADEVIWTPNDHFAVTVTTVDAESQKVMRTEQVRLELADEDGALWATGSGDDGVAVLEGNRYKWWVPEYAFTTTHPGRIGMDETLQLTEGEDTTEATAWTSARPATGVVRVILMNPSRRHKMALTMACPAPGSADSSRVVDMNQTVDGVPVGLDVKAGQHVIVGSSQWQGEGVGLEYTFGSSDHKGNQTVELTLRVQPVWCVSAHAVVLCLGALHMGH